MSIVSRTLSVLVFLGCATGASRLHAVEIEYTTGTSLASSGQAVAAVAGDLDRDGDLDLLVGSQTTGVTWLENDGSSESWPAHAIDASFDSRHLALEDLDRDGDLDAIGGQFGGAVTWWENLGDGASWAATELETTGPGVHFEGSFGVAAGDLDGDGDVDLVAANGGLGWWRNVTGDASSFAFTDVSTLAAVSQAFRPALADFDSDGDLDIVTAGGDGEQSVCWYENDAAAGDAISFTRHVIAGAQTFRVATVTVADINGDGAPDVLASMGSDDTSSGEVRWFEADGTDHDVDLAFAKTQWSSAADLDRDGDLDVLATSWTEGAVSGAAAWWENTDGSGSAWTKRTLGEFGNGGEILAADLDRDGDGDVVAAHFGGVDRFENRTIHRSASFNLDPAVAAPPHLEVLSTSEDGVRFVAMGDLDRDGDLDLATMAEGDFVAWWENPGSPGNAWSRHTIATLTILNSGGLEVGDLDGDSDLDVAAVSGPDFWWWENDGLGGGWTEHAAGDASGAYTQLSLGDVDGDGHLDVVFGNNSFSEHFWWRNTNGDGATWTEHGIVTGVVASLPSYSRLADLDRDGDVDLLVPGAVQWLENDDPTAVSSWSAHVILKTIGNPTDAEAVDVDADGDLDVAAAVGTSLAWWENGDGTGTSWIEHVVSIATVDATTRIRGGDFDGDGDADLAVSSLVADIVRWYENVDGAGTYASVGHPIAVSLDSARGLGLGDLDRDGDLDLAAVAQNVDTVSWYQNRGGQLALPTAAYGPLEIANGDSGAVLQVEVEHLGRTGDDALELATVELLVADGMGTPLDATQYADIVDSVELYRDAPSTGTPGTWDALDSLVPSSESFDGGSGVTTLSTTAGDPLAQVSLAESPARLFVVAGLSSDATSHTPSSFEVTHLLGSSSSAVHAETAIPLALEHAEDVASGLVTAVLDADLQVTKTDGRDGVALGEQLSYVIQVSNAGPDDVVGAVVSDVFPDALTACSWTCTESVGAECADSGEGDITDTVGLQAGSSVEYIATCTVDLGFGGDAVENTAAVSVPIGVSDPVGENDTATDSTEVTSCGEANEIVLSGEIVADEQTFAACHTITAHDGFVVGATGEVTLRAGQRAILGAGFAVSIGGRLTVDVDPSLAGD